MARPVVDEARVVHGRARPLAHLQATTKGGRSRAGTGRSSGLTPVAAAGLALLFVVAGCLGPSGGERSPTGSGDVAPPATGTPASNAPDTGSGSPSPGPSDRPAASLPAGAVTVPPGGTPVTGEVPEAVLASIIDDAAERTGADPATARIVRAEAVTWRDGSLGCPEPGMFYTQALVDGYWVVVEIGGQTLDYRVGAHGAFRLCEQPTPSTP